MCPWEWESQSHLPAGYYAAAQRGPSACNSRLKTRLLINYCGPSYSYLLSLQLSETEVNTHICTLPGCFYTQNRTKAPSMDITYQEVQGSLKLSHVVSSSVGNIFQSHLKYYSTFTTISLPWFVSQSWTYHWAHVLVLIEADVRTSNKNYFS